MVLTNLTQQPTRLVSYQTLWMKAHHPQPFMAAVMSADMDNTDKIVTLVDECNNMGLNACCRLM